MKKLNFVLPPLKNRKEISEESHAWLACCLGCAHTLIDAPGGAARPLPPISALRSAFGGDQCHLTSEDTATVYDTTGSSLRKARFDLRLIGNRWVVTGAFPGITF